MEGNVIYISQAGVEKPTTGGRLIRILEAMYVSLKGKLAALQVAKRGNLGGSFEKSIILNFNSAL